MSMLLRMVALLSVGAIVAVSGMAPASANQSVVAVKSPHNVTDTVKRTVAALRARRLKVFAQLDHGKAAREFGMAMPAAVVIVFGNPKAGTPMMIKQPRAAIDFPLKALVYQDDKGQTWLAFNTGSYVFGTILRRHGLRANSKGAANYDKLLKTITAEVTKP